MTDSLKIRAPFTAEQVESLNSYQHSNVFHPFTCGECPSAVVEHSSLMIKVQERKLTATKEGWVCTRCGYTQGWAWDWMADGTWQRLASERWLDRG